MDTTEERSWLTVKEFMKQHKLGKNLVYEAVRQRRLKSCRLMGKILIASDALDLLAEE
jgi:hypothetical protein